jgi:hypothetical protein
MPHHRFDWHEHIKDVEDEYRAARFALNELSAALERQSGLLKKGGLVRAHLRKAHANLEGTYLVRLFASFEAALRSYDRVRHNDPERHENASVLIDTIGGRRGQGISDADRAGAHAVRRVRNYWAHEDDASTESMTIAAARGRLQKYLSWLPEQWG